MQRFVRQDMKYDTIATKTRNQTQCAD